jgi:hypothetical protein
VSHSDVAIDWTDDDEQFRQLERLQRDALAASYHFPSEPLRLCNGCGSYIRKNRDRCPACGTWSALAQARLRVEERRGR